MPISLSSHEIKSVWWVNKFEGFNLFFESSLTLGIIGFRENSEPRALFFEVYPRAGKVIRCLATVKRHLLNSFSFEIWTNFRFKVLNTCNLWEELSFPSSRFVCKSVEIAATNRYGISSMALILSSHKKQGPLCCHVIRNDNWKCWWYVSIYLVSMTWT